VFSLRCGEPLYMRSQSPLDRVRNATAHYGFSQIISEALVGRKLVLVLPQESPVLDEVGVR